ncbi:MAG TPA: hypothetical protein ENN40_10810 [Candidatus Aminicenantes bacterium]|nr:hypothetical protein [Candidatus Aminicenantes bacterium]
MQKLLCLSLLLIAARGLASTQSIQVSGRYFIYCDNLKIIFGSGDIVVKSGDLKLRGNVLYYDVSTLRGILYGGAPIDAGDAPPHIGDSVYFQAIPPRFHAESFGERIAGRGNDVKRFQLRKPTLAEFKDHAIYFEFRGFSIDARGKVRAETVIPYIMGVPSMPMRHFSVNRGSLEGRTIFYLEDLHYTRAEGLALDSRLRLHLRPFHGDFSLKAVERALFGLPGTPRGLLYTGQLALRPKKTDMLNMAVRGSTKDRSFSLTLSHADRLGILEYDLSQQFSDRAGSDLFSEIRARLALHPFKGFRPQFSFRYNWGHSISYRITTPLEVKEKIRLSLGLERRILREGFESDQLDLQADFGFQTRLFSLDSGIRINRDMLEKTNRRNSSVQVPLTPIHLLEKNLSLAITPFYLFNSFPSGEETQTSSSPGIRLLARSRGLRLPLGFELRPSLAVHHIWDGLQEDMTDFQTDLVLGRRVGGVDLTAEYGLASRFRSRGFWVEGTHTRNLSFAGTFQLHKDTSLRLRMILDNDLKPETLTWNGRVRLPWNLQFSSFVIYYIRGERFQTLELFVEKVFKHKLKIQGGYSLALRKFFIKLLLV